MTKVTRNLGQVAALFIGFNPPANIKMLYYNQNTNTIMYYDTLANKWLPLGASGGGGGAYNPIITGATSISPIATDFSGNSVYICTSNGTVLFTLPDATVVLKGVKIKISMRGGGLLKIQNSVAGQELDEQNIDTAVTVLQPQYFGAGFIPAQQFAFYSDGANWNSDFN